MKIKLPLKNNTADKIQAWLKNADFGRLILIISITTAVIATSIFFYRGELVSYGDSESHLNIAKRVVDSLTPGFAQLGGIWLPLPHVLMLPFVEFDILWRTGLAGSIVSGIAYIISAFFIYKTILLLTNHRLGSFIGALVFVFNPNILYLQSTAMTELPLIAFFVLASYYFIYFLMSGKILHIVYSGFFTFCATLSRYDGWFLAMFIAIALVLYFLPFKSIPKSISEIKSLWDTVKWHKLEGAFILFCTIAFFGVGLWLLWDFLILGDPLYFTHSQFSAKSQQQGWLAKGQLPAYHDVWLSLLYYFITAMSNIGVVATFMAIIGFILYFKKDFSMKKFLIGGVLGSIFAFYVVTMYIGQSIIFIPHVTPPNFEWNLFNVRYGVMMVSFSAIFVGYLFSVVKLPKKLLILFLLLIQAGLWGIGYSPVISHADGVVGLSRSKQPDAEIFFKKEYDGGLVLIDDFSRTMSVIRSGVPMENIIYIGNQHYWTESFEAPEKYARWIIFQKNDEIWNRIYSVPQMQGRLFTYFVKVYESPDILIFKKQSI